jgi:hypothetical protein
MKGALSLPTQLRLAAAPVLCVDREGKPLGLRPFFQADTIPMDGCRAVTERP